MFKQSFSHTTSSRALCHALFLIAAIVSQSLALPKRGVAFAPTPSGKTIELSSATESQPKLPDANVFLPTAPEPQNPNAPQAAVIVATLTDNVTAATKIAPGANINYTATITNNGAVVGTDDAINLNFSAPLDANTTLVSNSIHSSPIAFNNTYNWVGNTVLDTSARSLPAVTANDVAVNAPGGTDTFNVTTIAGGATALGGTVTLLATGHYTYTPPLNRPNIADGAAVNDSFTYTISNSADPTLTSTGTVTITLTGRVFYLQAGAAGDGRSGTPSGNPATMSTNADKASDIFYIFSNAGSLSGLFTVDAGQQLLGQGVALAINIPVLGSTTLFPAQAPTPTTTNGAGNGVTLAGAPGNNTLSGFNIGNCSGFAIQGANVGTLAVSTVSINTTGGGLDLTGVSTPTVNIVLGGLTSTGGTNNVRLVGLNGTVTLGSGTLSGSTAGAANHAFFNSGGNAGITFSGSITKANQGNVVNIASRTGGTVTLSGTINGTGSNGINVSSNTGGTIDFTNGTKTLSTGANAAVTLATNTGTTINFTNGGLDIDTTSGAGFAATGGGTVTVTTGANPNTIDSTTGTALNVANTAIGASGLTFRSIASNGAPNGIVLNTTGATGGLTVTGNSAGICGGSVTNTTTPGTIATVTAPNTADCTGGTIQSSTGAGVSLNTTTGVSLTRMNITGGGDDGIRGTSVTGLTLSAVNIANNGNAVGESGMDFGLSGSNLLGTVSITNSSVTGSFSDNVNVINTSGTLASLTISGCNFSQPSIPVSPAGGNGFVMTTQNAAVVTTASITDSMFRNNFSNGFLTNAENTSSIGTFTVQNSSFDDNNISLQCGQFQSSNFTCRFITNTVFNNGRAATSGPNSTSTAIVVGTSSTSTGGAMNSRIAGNSIGNSTVAGSGSSTGSGIRAVTQGKAGAVHTIINNTIREAPCGFGIDIEHLGSTSGGPVPTSDVTVTGNNVDHRNLPFKPGTSDFPLPAIYLAGDNQGTAGTLRSDVTGNTVPTGTVCGSGGSCQFLGTWIELFEYTGPTGDLQLVDTGAASANATAQLTSTNTGSSSASAGVILIAGPINTTARNKSDTGQRDYLAQIDNPFENDHSSITFAQLTSTSTPDSVFTASLNNVACVKTPASMPPQVAPTEKPVVAGVAPASTSYRAAIGNVMHHALGTMASAANKLDSIITPTAYAQDLAPNAPTSGENVTINTIATFPAGGKSITIKYSATVNSPPQAKQVSTQGTVTANGGISVVTDDPEPAGGPQATVTLVDTLITWNGATNTDWNTVTNWTQPAGGTQYAPGVSNPAINDVVIPNVGAQPNISATHIGIFSLNIANGRTLTITNPRVLTIGSSPGGDLTLDGIISGGNLNLGTGTHVINNAGGTGSLSSTNVATVLSGSTVTLNNNLQAGALAVNAGGSMNITNRTLSLNGSGVALTIPGGATFTTTGSTVVYNGTAAQQAAGIAYNNLTINNSIGAHVTGVTLTGNASVAGVLTLTSSDLATTGAFTLTMPAAATSGPASGATDVVGNVKRTGFVSGGSALSFGNPFNTIRINSGAAPADINMLIAKNPPATYAAAVSRSYTITPNGANGPATLRLHYRQAELNGNSETPTVNFNFRKGPNWSAVVPTNRSVGVVEDNWLENNTVASFSEWTFANLAPTASDGVISGRITREDGTPVEGAVVNLSGGQTRKTITDAEGSYHFNNVDSDGFYTVTPGRVNYSFNPFHRAFTLVGNQTEAAFTGTMLGDNLNPIDTPEYFVRQQYVDILGREGDEGGFNYWSDKILACAGDVDCTRAERTGVAAAFFIEREFKDSGAFIYNVYQSALGRGPVYSEYSADRRQVVGGPSLEEQRQAFAAAFVARAEFARRYENNTTAESFVDALLANVQASGVDLSSQRDSLIGRYNTGANQTEARTFVLRDLTDSAAVREANYNGAFVLVEYFGYLRRNPDPRGYAFWLNVLNNGDTGNYRGMVCSFITSTEYQRRFSVVVSRSNAECGQ